MVLLQVVAAWMRYNSVQIHQVFICTVIHHPCFEISYVVFLNFYVFCPGQSLCFIVVVHLPGFIHRAWNEFSLTSEPWCRDKVKKLYFSTIISSNIRQDQEVMLCPVRLIIWGTGCCVVMILWRPWTSAPGTGAGSRNQWWMRNSDDPITWPILHRWAASTQH